MCGYVRLGFGLSFLTRLLLAGYYKLWASETPSLSVTKLLKNQKSVRKVLFNQKSMKNVLCNHFKQFRITPMKKQNNLFHELDVAIIG